MGLQSAVASLTPISLSVESFQDISPSWENITTAFANVTPTARGTLYYLATHKVLAVFGFVLIYHFIRATYLLFFHPLARFPGPKIAAISGIWLGYVHISGRSIWIIKDMHAKYGPVVRIAPNDLSFATPTSYRDIFKSRQHFTKTEFFDAIDSGFGEHGIGTERDVATHLRKRKFLTPAFTPQATWEFEPLVLPHLDRFMSAIEERGKTEEGVDMVEWFQFLTFDTAGDLAFGEAFGALDKGISHRWMSMVTECIDVAAYVEAARRFPIFNSIFKRFIPQVYIDARKWHVAWSKEQTLRRISSPSERKDILGYMVDKHGKSPVTHDELTAHSSQLILGGAETMTAMLCGTIYHLAKTRRVIAHLQGEIRTKFACLEDITAGKLGELPYLTAVIKEGLRVFPPGPTGLPRYSPGAFVAGNYIPKGVKVSTHPWTLCHGEEWWDSPDEFRPERWIDEDNTDVKEASVPFGLGSRQCLGQNLAWMEMRLYIARMMFLYDLKLVKPEEDLIRKCKTYFMWLKAPLMVKVERRIGY